jgi:hypothetical protein
MPARASVFAIVGMEKTDVTPMLLLRSLLTVHIPLLIFYLKHRNNPGQPNMTTIIVLHLMHYLQIIDMIPRPAMHSPP